MYVQDTSLILYVTATLLDSGVITAAIVFKLTTVLLSVSLSLGSELPCVLSVSGTIASSGLDFIFTK